MATAGERREAARTKRVGKEDPGAETVAASEVEVGDSVFFPNSRKAQPVESIVDNPNTDPPTRNVIGPDISWQLPLTAEVRRMAR